MLLLAAPVLLHMLPACAMSRSVSAAIQLTSQDQGSVQGRTASDEFSHTYGQASPTAACTQYAVEQDHHSAGQSLRVPALASRGPRSGTSPPWLSWLNSASDRPSRSCP